MSIFGRILERLRGHSQTASAAPSTAVAPPQSPAPSDDLPPPGPSASAAPTPNVATQASAPQSTAPQTAAPEAMSPQAATPVDVEAILTGLAQQAPQKLDWRHSIVDLMKLLGLDSSLEARRELAKELNYSGDTGDSAAMNIWLHKQVMRKLAENGGKVPAELRN